MNVIPQLVAGSTSRPGSVQQFNPDRAQRTQSRALLVRAVHRDGVPDELRGLPTCQTLRFQFVVDLPDGGQVRARLRAEARNKQSGARKISVVAAFMSNGDHLIRRADNAVSREQRQKLVIERVSVSDRGRQQ